MAPIRRYLRISKYSVLECRIYLENPADTRWLLNPRDRVLTRIFAAIRPQVLPKLREENERAIAKKKSKPVKDVIVEDDFEVAIFLRESGTRHSLLTRQKTFEDTKKITSNSNRLTGTDTSPIHIDEEAHIAGHVVVESDRESDMDLRDIPEASQVEEDSGRSKRRRTTGISDDSSDAQHPASKRNRRQEHDETGAGAEDEKKLGMTTSYEGFNIWGWVLCLLVTRRGEKARKSDAASETTGQVLLEEWISTQAPGGFDEQD